MKETFVFLLHYHGRIDTIHHPGILCENWGILKWWPPKTNCPRSIDWPMVITKYSNKAEEWAKNTNRLLLSSSFPPPGPPGSSNKIEGRRTSVYPSPPQILAQGFVGIQKVNNTRGEAIWTYDAVIPGYFIITLEAVICPQSFLSSRSVSHNFRDLFFAKLSQKSPGMTIDW